MQKALKIESNKSEESGTRCSRAGTKLNICAILSSQNKHRDAIVYARNAISDIYILYDYESLLTEIQIGMVEPATQFEDLDMPTLLLSLSIAYYNLGAEYEHCKEYKSAEVAYEKWLYIFEKSLQYAYFFALKAPPEVASQMIKEASRSIREVIAKEMKRMSSHGKRLMLRIDSKNLYPSLLQGRASEIPLSHRHQPDNLISKQSNVDKFKRPRRRVISVDATQKKVKFQFHTIDQYSKRQLSVDHSLHYEINIFTIPLRKNQNPQGTFLILKRDSSKETIRLYQQRNQD